MMELATSHSCLKHSAKFQSIFNAMMRILIDDQNLTRSCLADESIETIPEIARNR